MALAARCPHCHALFRVVADQLKLRGGLVRCGACREVFDAIGSLSYVNDQSLAVQGEAPIGGSAVPGPAAQASGPAAKPDSPQPEAYEPPARPSAPPAAASREARASPRPNPASRSAAPAYHHDAAAALELSDALSVPTVIGAMSLDEQDAAGDAIQARAERAAELSIVPAVERRATPRPVPQAPPPGPDDFAGHPSQSDAFTPDGETPDEPQAEESDADENDAASGPEAASFLLGEETPRERRWRWIVSTACVPLAALAACQLVLALREPVLETWPDLRPALVRACAWYGCVASWPAHAEMLAIVGSELASIPGTDVVELNASVRSRAPFTMALPAIEVTLTDAQNRTIARKVFLPVDYLASNGEPSSRIDEGLVPNTDFSIHLVFEARGLNASGFVVYPFYL